MKEQKRGESVDAESAARAIFRVVTESIDDDDATVIGRVRVMLQTYGFRASGVSPSPPAWQPMETAPKGPIVLVHDDGYIGKAQLQDNGRWLDVECGRDDAWFDPPPQQWMPLPDPPVAPDTKE